MKSSDFTRNAERKGTRKHVDLNYHDEASGRYFCAREKHGATDMEVVTGKAKAVRGATDGVRYFLEEYKPNGRLCTHDAEGKPENFIDVPAGPWTKAKGVPSKAWRLIKRHVARNPGYEPIMWGSGYGVSSIFCANLDECATAINNALDTDMWVSSDEATKHVVLAERTLATLEAKGLLDRLPGGEQVMAAVLEVASGLGETETVRVGEHMGGLRIDVTDSRLEHPACCRMLLIFSPTGQVVARPGYFRGNWGSLASRIAGRELPNYDGPAGVSSGFPGHGQAFGNPGRPAEVTEIEVLHKMEGTANKIYLYAEVGGRSFFAWGRFAGGKLQKKPASRGSRYGQLSDKRATRYEPIDADSVPDIWARVKEAAESLK